jgi:platelet-activating factor acetylhydrolase IB subunit alpha
MAGNNTSKNLSSKQEEELCLSILDYLSQNGLSKTYNSFIEETNIASRPEAKHEGILEKKWTSIIRLQKRIMELEKELSERNDPTKKIVSRGYPNQPEQFTLTSHQKGVNSISFHPIFSIVCSGSEDGTIKIWNLDTGVLEQTLIGHIKGVTGTCYSQDGNFLISCSLDQSIKVWNAQNGYLCVKTLQGHDNTISNVCMIKNTDLFATVSRDESIKIWDLHSG